MKHPIALLSIMAVVLVAPLALAGTVQVHNAPAGEELSKDYTVQVEGQDVPVYSVKVASADRILRFRAMDDKTHSADYFGNASFAYFDMEGSVTVKVTCSEPIRTAKALPSSYKISPTIDGKTLTFTLKEPKPVTIEVNGSWVGALHLFANPPETNIPKSGDPNVIYYGPGIHEVSHVVVTNNQTVYVAPGAVVAGYCRARMKAFRNRPLQPPAELRPDVSVARKPHPVLRAWDHRFQLNSKGHPEPNHGEGE